MARQTKEKEAGRDQGVELTVEVDGKQVPVLVPPTKDDRPRLGLALADARRELGRAEAQYRWWRADYTLRIIADHSKWPEWRVKAAIESHERFLSFKEALLKAGWNVDVLVVALDGGAGCQSSISSR